jgi:hypothetical protein
VSLGHGCQLIDDPGSEQGERDRLDGERDVIAPDPAELGEVRHQLRQRVGVAGDAAGVLERLGVDCRVVDEQFAEPAD